MKSTFALLLLLASLSAAEARTVTMEVSFNNSYTFDYVAGQNLPVPFSGTASVSFNVDGPVQYVDYGSGSFSYYYGSNYLNGASLASSMTPLIPAYVNDIVVPYNSYAFQLTYDYPTDFIEQFGSRTDARATVDGLEYTRDLSIYTGLWGWGAPRNGDGTSDFFYMPDEIVSFLQGAVGKEVWFEHSYSVYAPIPGGGATYLDGKAWSDYHAIITSVTVSPVPEPGTAAMLFGGLALIGGLRRTWAR